MSIFEDVIANDGGEQWAKRGRKEATPKVHCQKDGSTLGQQRALMTRDRAKRLGRRRCSSGPSIPIKFEAFPLHEARKARVQILWPRAARLIGAAELTISLSKTRRCYTRLRATRVWEVESGHLWILGGFQLRKNAGNESQHLRRALMAEDNGRFLSILSAVETDTAKRKEDDRARLR